MTLAEIVEFLAIAKVSAVASRLDIKGINSLKRANFQELSFCENERMVAALASTGAGAVIVNESLAGAVPKDSVPLISPNPKVSFALLSKLYAKPLFGEKAASVIDKSAVVMEGAYIGKCSSIGARSIIMPGVFIGDNVHIGKDCIIHPNVVIYNDSLIGDDCILQANCVIGSDGFGFATNKNGEHFKIYHSGNVVLEEGVEVGACSTIDRALFESTIIGRNTKIDNLVQVGHNCELGSHCLIISQAGLAGSSRLGQSVVMGGQSATSGHLEIGDFAMIAARGGVTKNLKGGQVYGGFPISTQREWLKNQAKWAKILANTQD